MMGTKHRLAWRIAKFRGAGQHHATEAATQQGGRLRPPALGPMPGPNKMAIAPPQAHLVGRVEASRAAAHDAELQAAGGSSGGSKGAGPQAAGAQQRSSQPGQHDCWAEAARVGEQGAGGEDGRDLRVSCGAETVANHKQRMDAIGMSESREDYGECAPARHGAGKGATWPSGREGSL